MADKKAFWTTVPGIISGVAAIITGLAVLIPIVLGVGGKHRSSNAPSGPPPGGSPSASGSASGGPAVLATDPSSVSFGGVVVGKSAQDVTVTVTSSGGDATIDTVEITGAAQGAFTIAGTTCGNGSTIAAQSSCQVTLRFTPSALGAASASLEIHYHPPDSSFTTVSLSGNGTLL